jgi:hypothetical protein
MKRPDTFREVAAVTDADSVPRLSCGDALRAFNRPLALFTPAVLFTHGHFDRDPVVEFDARFPAPNRDLRPFCVDLTQTAEPFFHGLGVSPAPQSAQPVNWDKRLYAIDQSRAKECFSFLSGITFSDPTKNFYAAAFTYGLDFTDPTSAKDDWLSVMVVGVITNRSVIFLEPQLTSRPQLKKYPLHDGRLPPPLRGQSVFTSFDGEDPLKMRDE